MDSSTVQTTETSKNALTPFLLRPNGMVSRHLPGGKKYKKFYEHNLSYLPKKVKIFLDFKN